MKKMRTRIIAGLLVMACACILLSGCGRLTGELVDQLAENGQVGLTYDDAEKYTAGGADLHVEITDLDVEWIDGTVRVAYHDKDTVSFSETINGKDGEGTDSLDPNGAALHYLVEGSTLHIKYAKSGMHDLENISKDLTILIPRSMVLKGFEFDSVSGELVVEDVTMDQVECDIVSCNVTFEDGSAIKKLETDTVSGNVTVYLSEDIGFTLEFDTVSGNVDSDFDVKWDSDHERCSFGSGGCDMEVDSVSGNVGIYRK